MPMHVVDFHVSASVARELGDERVRTILGADAESALTVAAGEPIRREDCTVTRSGFLWVENELNGERIMTPTGDDDAEYFSYRFTALTGIDAL